MHFACLRPRLLRLLPIVLIFTGVLSAQIATRDLTAGSVKNNPDVTNGLKYLLEEDDAAIVELTSGPNGIVQTTVSTVDSKNSNFGIPQSNVVNVASPNGTWSPTSYSNSVGLGRIFDIATDDVGVLAPGDGPVWNWFLSDPATNFQGYMTLKTGFNPYGGVYTQIVMGNFLRNFLATPLLFYLSNGQNQTEWAMRVLTPTDPKTEQLPLTEGPEFYSFNHPGTAVPITGSIVAGDFNGDGKDEIALLLTDNKTIVFYSVNRKTLTISQTNTLTLPQAFGGGGGTLVAARFRNTTNAELVATGPVGGNLTIYSIQVTPNANHTGFTPTVVQTHVRKGYPTYRTIASPASILVPLQTTNQQIVIGLIETPGAFIEIGSFHSDFSYQHLSFSDLGADIGPPPDAVNLFSFSVGNFDHQNGNNTHNPALQLETYTQDAVNGAVALNIFNITPSQKSDWLQGVSENFLLNQSGIIATASAVGDLQGRSLRLGSPEIVTIPQQIQPDIVLGLPPMHIDWVTPTIAFQNTALRPGCDTTTQPCLLNLTVLPSVPAPSIGFQTGFNFVSNSDSQGSRKSTTSWGISVKNVAKLKVTWGNAFIGGSFGIKNTAQYAHDHTVAHTYNHYQGIQQGISATTGFADHVFYTEKDLNIYYYPVIAQAACPNNDPNCSQKEPEYVEFSVPDQVTHYDLDGATLEWYQPTHEAGNALSYPWTLAQLQQGFVNTANPLSENPAPVQGTDTSQTVYTTTWTGGQGQTNTSGSTNSFSDDLSISYSSQAGIEDVEGGKFSDKFSVGGSTSLSTLNENTSSLSASSGIAVNKPAFDSEVVNCCIYNFGSYIFGQQNETNPVWQSIKVADPHGHPVTLQSTGPLFVGFVDQLRPSQSVAPFFAQAYNLPDVSVNHPARWSWSKFEQRASFNSPTQSNDPLSNSFYHMKGFFIIKTGEATTAPNLSEASAGDQLSLSARIYNYSLVDTNSGSLAHPAASIHVRFYGQFLCETGDDSENSCIGVDGKTCTTPYTLCGNSFLIGETTLASIPGYNSPSNEGSQPNWALTTPVNFDTTPYANSYLVFWVVTWMEDANGNLVPEMPDHGLTANPATLNFQQITQVPFELHSNNIGMYGVNSPFYVCPQTVCSPPNGLTARRQGYLESVTVATREKLHLDERAQVTTHLRATNGDITHVNLLYYDGDPKKGGRLFDVQRIAHMAPDLTYTHRAFFRAQTCGVHELFARAFTDDSPDFTGNFTTYVTILPV